MAVTLVENGKDLCSVAAFRIHSGAREVIDVPVLGGGGFTVPGRKDVDGGQSPTKSDGRGEVARAGMQGHRFLGGRLGGIFWGGSSRSKEWRSRQESASMSTL